ncbi:viral A-type inclusion protein [uncultured Clostridium sp.]|uniref:viral A-type inclusion protein n=1 Tax=uncultured Clostridium sp. TaxID=59620 RepID=UPI003217CD6F
MKINAMGINISQNNSINKASALFKNIKVDEDKKESKNLKLNNNSQNELLNNLEKIKKGFLDQKETLREKQMSPEEKKYKMEEINSKIQEVEAQIQQVLMNEKQKEIDKKKEELEAKKVEAEKNKVNEDEVKDGVIISASLNELIEISHSTENINRLKDIKNRLKVESGYIVPNDNSNSYSNKKLASLSRGILNLESKIANEIGNINKNANSMMDKIDNEIDKLEKSKNEEKKAEEELQEN